MNKIIFCLIIFISSIAFAQQEMNTEVNGHGNNIEVTQERNDTGSQKMTTKTVGDTNKIKKDQNSDARIPLDSDKKEEPLKFIDFINNSNSLITLFISIATLIAAWRGILYYKKKNNSK